MTSVLNPWGETAYYEYSPGGKLLARTLGNGCVTYYAYDRRGVTKVENLKSDLSVISTFEYQRDRTGNPLSILREDGSCVYYEYDLNQQLTAETQTDDTGAVVYAREWDYDRAGNRLWQTFNGTATYYEYNAGNELVTETTGSATTYYDYDRNGNQTAKQSVDGTTYFHYDFENLLRQIDLPDGAHNYFTYDADSKRVSAQDSTGYTRFIYQGPDMLKLMQEKNAAGETQAQYTTGQGLESMRRGSVSSFYHYDALGSAQELTDAAEAVTDTYRYNAWGILVKRTGSTMNPHSYVGRERYYADADAVLYMLGLRYLDALLARFLRRDPVGDGLGAYLYAENSPAVGVDPSGLQSAPTMPWDCVMTYDQWWAKCEAIFAPAPRSQCMSAANAWVRRCKERLGYPPCQQWRQPAPPVYQPPPYYWAPAPSPAPPPQPPPDQTYKHCFDACIGPCIRDVTDNPTMDVICDSLGECCATEGENPFVGPECCVAYVTCGVGGVLGKGTAWAYCRHICYVKCAAALPGNSMGRF